MEEHCKHIEDKEVRELSLIYTDLCADNPEEAYYVHTINVFVELIVLYGWDKVTSDLRAAMAQKEW